MKLLKNNIFLLLICIVLLSCKEAKETKTTPSVFNKALSEELIEMLAIDQVAAMPRDKERFPTREAYLTFKDSVFRAHKVRLEKIFKEYGYPGIDKVGKKGALSFWAMVQHSDFDYKFQKKILLALEEEVKNNNAKPSHLALLTDRVNINQGLPQIYGTQVTYNSKEQATPRDLKDSSTVDVRRKAVGLPPLKEYLNTMTSSHFEMNKENFVKLGITEPNLYK